MRAKAQGERVADQRQESPEEYAQGEVQQGISGAVDRVNGTTQSTARMSYRKFRMMQDRRRKVDIQDSAATTLKPPEKEQVIVPTQTERRKMFKKQRFRQKAVAAKKSAPQAPALPADILAPTLPHYRAQIALLRRSAGRSIAGRVKLPLPIIRSKYRRSQPASESCGGRLPPVLTLRWTARWCRIRCKGRRIGGKTRPVKEYIAAPIDFSFFLI